MPLPNNPTQCWPPECWQEIYATYNENAAWYGGDMERLASIYARRLYGPYGLSSDNSPSQYNPYQFQSNSVANAAWDEVRNLVHVPAAADIAGTSAAMLFGEHPKIKIDDDSTVGIATQETLELMIQETNLLSMFSEAADTCAGLGGVFLKINWDVSLSPYPIISVAQADNALPEFSFGILRAVTFWRELPTDDNSVMRLLERHEPGVIISGLYSGSPTVLGKSIDINSHPESYGTQEIVQTGLDGLACVYIPNMLPNRKHRGLRIGQSDYAASESLMLSLDDVFTSLLRDIKLGLGRIIAPAEFFEQDEQGLMRFDVFKQAYLKIDAIQGAGSANESITVSQFAIRTQEHIDAAWAFLRQIYVSGGYSPQTFGMDINGSAESGTALTIRERKSFITSAKKADYWKPALEYILYAAQIIYKLKLGGKITPFKPDVEMQDGVQTDIAQVATSVELLSRAQSASIETRVRMVHPDWDAERVKAEVDAIMGESGLNVPDPAALGRGNA